MDPVERFSALAAAPEPELDRCTLTIAAGANPSLDVDRWLRELDKLADRVSSLDELLRRLFAEEGFDGNRERYYDPRNSLLDQVLARRLGIPIMLSVVCIEVGRRAGVALEGVGMPGHFLIRPVGSDVHVDPFGGGAVLDLAGCEALFRTSTGAGPDVAFGPHLLTSTSTAAILVRVLQNLRAVYRARSAFADLEWTLRMRLALPGVDAGDVLELGQAIGGQARFLDAAAFLESRAREYPDQTDTLNYAARRLRANLN